MACVAGIISVAAQWAYDWMRTSWLGETVVDMTSSGLTLQECLHAFTATEHMRGANQYHCDVCKGRSDAEFGLL